MSTNTNEKKKEKFERIKSFLVDDIIAVFTLYLSLMALLDYIEV